MHHQMIVEAIVVPPRTPPAYGPDSSAWITSIHIAVYVKNTYKKIQKFFLWFSAIVMQLNEFDGGTKETHEPCATSDMTANCQTQL